MPSAPSLVVVVLLCLLLLARPAHAFGAGEVPADSSFHGYVFRHGDLVETLKYLPTSFVTGYRFTKLQRKQVYFGNWLRDFSQVIDTTCLENVPEPILRALVSVMAFLEFGFATDEFDVTRERLGCYTHVEHIDNPRGYPDNARDIDDRLRGPVDAQELAIDPATGMKNYIANAGRGWATSADYLREQLSACIAAGRKGRRKYEARARKDSFRHLGAALHTLEDFAAHSNFVELCLRELGEDRVFVFVGDECRVTVPRGPAQGRMVAPVVTGTFGMLDIFHSLLGEADDKAILQSKGSLGELETKLNYGGMAFDQIFHLLKSAIEQLSKLQPDIDPLLRQLQAVGEIFKKYAPNSNQPPSSPGIPDANILWQTIEPVLYLHDKVSKYLQEDQEDAEESTQDYTHGPVGEYTNQLVFKYLSVMIESSVKELRNAVRAARDRVDEEAAKSESAQVYSDPLASDPSHSDLSKDHFGNVLNQPAGLVATVTTNWATQKIVRCWDDSTLDADACIDEIVQILHHPCFPEHKSPVQEYMFATVRDWWESHSEADKHKLRSRLTKDSVQQRKHEDHTMTIKDFEGTHQGPAGFPDAWPRVRQPPKKPTIMAQWTNGVIADLNWALGIVRKGRSDPLGALKDVRHSSGSLLHNLILVYVAVVYTLAHSFAWLLSRLLWPFGRASK